MKKIIISLAIIFSFLFASGQTTNFAVYSLSSATTQILSSTATLNFPSTLTLTSSDLTITVTGAADGDPVSVGVPNGSILANSNFTAWVSSANTVTIRFSNFSAISLDPASGSFRATVTKN